MSANRFPTPDPTTTAPTRSRMVTYYRQNGIVVTSHYFSAGGYRYEIPQLSSLMQTRGSIHPGVMVGMVTTVTEAIVIVPLVSVFGAPVVWLLAVAALLVPCLVGYACQRRWPPQYELLATYRGRQVMLFTTRSEREFGQVARGLQRAMERAMEAAASS